MNAQRWRREMHSAVHRMRWHMHRLLGQAGWMGNAALALAVLLIAWQIGMQAPRRAALLQAQQSLHETLQRLQQAAANAAQPAQSGAGVLGSDIEGRKFVIFELLKKRGLQVDSATYRKDDEMNGKLHRWTLTISAHGRYLDLARSMAALREQAMVRVHDVSIERGKIETGQLKIHVRLSLLARPS